jgi:hypothetical protein
MQTKLRGKAASLSSPSAPTPHALLRELQSLPRQHLQRALKDRTALN